MGQENLIINAGFENADLCRENRTLLDRRELCIDWYMPLGTPDHYSKCTRGEVSVPRSFTGVQAPSEGESYIGLIVGDNFSCAGELVVGKINKPLVANQLYHLLFNISLADGSKNQINYFEITFSHQLPKNKRGVKKLHTSVIIDDSSKLEIVEGWATIAVDYLAKGDEHFIMFGNYDCNQKNWFGKENQKYSSRYPCFNGVTYYYLDNIQLYQSPSEPNGTLSTKEFFNVATTPMVDSNKAFKSYVLENVHFESGSSAIQDSSTKTLNELAEFLLQYPAVWVKVIGHTDHSGNSIENLKLSQSRAESVANHLIQHGINSNRLNAVGMGDQEPVTDNTSEIGRALNRRVVIEVFNL